MDTSPDFLSPPSLGSCIILLVAPLHRVQGAQASHVHHPSVFQFPEERVSLLPGARIINLVKEVYFNSSEVPRLVSVVSGPVLFKISERLTSVFSKALDFENFWLRIQKYSGYGQKGYSWGTKKKSANLVHFFFKITPGGKNRSRGQV